MIRVFCSCGRAFKAEDRHAGRHTKCPECGADLVIGQVPISSSSGGDMEEVPSWWYPSDSSGPGSRRRPQLGVVAIPIRSRYDGLAHGQQSEGQASSYRIISPHAVASSGTQVSPPEGSERGSSSGTGSPRPFLVKKLWGLSGGTMALAVLAVGAILWIRLAPPGGNAARPHPGELSRPRRITRFQVRSRHRRHRGRKPKSSRTGSRANRPAMARLTLQCRGRTATSLLSPNRLLRGVRATAIVGAGLYLSRWMRAGKSGKG